MRIRLYGRLGDAIGAETELNAPDGCTVAEVRQLLADGHPAAADALRRSRACKGSRLVDDDQTLSSGDTVEFLPPVSGG